MKGEQRKSPRVFHAEKAAAGEGDLRCQWMWVNEDSRSRPRRGAVGGGRTLPLGGGSEEAGKGVKRKRRSKTVQAVRNSILEEAARMGMGR